MLQDSDGGDGSSFRPQDPATQGYRLKSLRRSLPSLVRAETALRPDKQQDRTNIGVLLKNIM